MSDANPHEAGHLKHLDYIQAAITRMAANSFLIKGWGVTLVTAIVALGIANKLSGVIPVALLPIAVLWGLDAYFLRQERRFRSRWNAVRKADWTAPADFEMLPQATDEPVASWLRFVFSATLLPFHGVLAVIVALLSILTPVGSEQCRNGASCADGAQMAVPRPLPSSEVRQVLVPDLPNSPSPCAATDLPATGTRSR